ncbi:NUDIX hydrolase [Actinomadura harenae]|uniref:NUDIX domain-containing protein n=1 Tax=Actinomadura harenae TaxID=2483351 RepID=A0A3M2MD38_9ACTN|nr:NUDIX domain-containing protein [Actinomadura harenae]RMI47376.1 NUDIX domain-containing protein [Actinomadura harenae]
MRDPGPGTDAGGPASDEEDGGALLSRIPPEPDAVHAAGGLVWRDAPPERDGLEVAVIHRPRHDDWTFPKGHVERGEHVLRAAVREIAEETGLVTELGRRLPSADYFVQGRPKRVDWWAASAVASTGPAFVPNHEVDALEWLPPDEADRRLSYSLDRDLLRAFTAGPRRTRPVVIVRHGDAGGKRDWREPDELRPLDQRGRVQSARLAPLLQMFGTARVVSSATARCVATVLPYARRARADVTTDLAFTVGETSPDRALDRLLALAADGPLIVCTHGEVVSGLVDGLCRRFGEKPPEDASLRKGAFWVAHLAGDSLAALEHHEARV